MFPKPRLLPAPGGGLPQFGYSAARKARPCPPSRAWDSSQSTLCVSRTTAQASQLGPKPLGQTANGSPYWGRCPHREPDPPCLEGLRNVVHKLEESVRNHAGFPRWLESARRAPDMWRDTNCRRRYDQCRDQRTTRESRHAQLHPRVTSLLGPSGFRVEKGSP